MDLSTIEAVLVPARLDDLPAWSEGSAFLGGGTWLFSEPQPHIRTLVDLAKLGWAAIEPSANGLRIGAMCTIAALERIEGDWPAHPAIAACCRALLGSFKVMNTATVGGNVCLALAASPMLALTVALDGVAQTWRPGRGERQIPMERFASGPQQTALVRGEMLRAIDLPMAALQRRVAVRQASLTRHGRSAALLVGTLEPEGAFALTVTGSTRRPLVFRYDEPPDAAALDATLAILPLETWYDDVHGAPTWRRHMTRRLAAEILDELRP